MEEKKDTGRLKYTPMHDDTLTLGQLRKARGWDD
tara:strand:- start:693 stop:794 length:102 start_codon:yes stop_codon:yes gene_type:complete